MMLGGTSTGPGDVAGARGSEKAKPDVWEDLRAAEEEGKAFDMLKVRRVCLASYPAIADASLDDAVNLLRGGPVQVQSKEMEAPCEPAPTVKAEAPCEPAPTVKANVLGNFLAAPTQAAESLLIQATEPMIVFAHSELASRTLEGNFPESLGCMFVRRLDAGDKNIFDETQRKVFIGGDLGLQCRTSPLYACTLSRRARKAALIPRLATHFCYVFASIKFIGGFIYFDNKRTLVAINAISFTPTSHALAFKSGVENGKPITMTPATSRHLEETAQKEPISVERLKERGATHYAFVPPRLVLTDERGFNSGEGGGFAYWLKNGKTVYFEIEGAGEVLARSAFHPSVAVRCAMLPDEACEQHLTLPSRFWTMESPLVGTAAGGAPMTVARLRIEDPLHPVVLRGLAFASRREVFDIVAAKAIAQLAFEQARAAIILDILFRLAMIGCLAALAHRIREELWDRTLFYVMLAVWARDALKEVCSSIGYCRQDWLDDRVSRHTFVAVVYLCSLLWLLCWIAQLDLNGAHKFPDLMRPMIAFLGAMSWMSLLYLLRGFRVARLGLRILPVFYSLWDTTDFVLITLFFVLAGAQAGFSLAPASMPPLQIMFSAYRLGFLGDFDVDHDIEYLTEDGGSGKEPALVTLPFQYLSFVVVSFVVAIAMTNILIGAMSSAFDFYQARSQASFVKHQAWLGLDHTLLEQGSSLLPSFVRLLLFGVVPHHIPAKHALWCCYRAEAALGEGADVSTSVRSVMEAVTAVQSDSARKLDGLTVQVEALAKNIDRLTGQVAAIANNMDEMPNDSARKLDGLIEQVAALAKDRDEMMAVQNDSGRKLDVLTVQVAASTDKLTNVFDAGQTRCGAQESSATSAQGPRAHLLESRRLGDARCVCRQVVAVAWRT